MRKRDSQSSEAASTVSHHKIQSFLMHFISRNYQRREIDEASFASFNRFLTALGNEVSERTTQADVKGFVKIVDTVFRNFQEINKNKQTFCLFVQLLQICLNIMERVVSLTTSRECSLQIIEFFWPLTNPAYQEENFQLIEQQFKIVSLSNAHETLSKAGTVSNLPALASDEKYDKMMGYMVRGLGDSDTIEYVFKGLLMLEGQNYLDVILKLITMTIEEDNPQFFTKILKIYLCIGDTHSTLMIHIEALMNKILRAKKKVEFFTIIGSYVPLEKCYVPDNLLSICLNILETIFAEIRLDEKIIRALNMIASYKQQFGKVEVVSDADKLLDLPVSMLSLVVVGKMVSDKNRKVSQSRPKIENKRSKSNKKGQEASLEIISQSQQREQQSKNVTSLKGLPSKFSKESSSSLAKKESRKQMQGESGEDVSESSPKQKMVKLTKKQAMDYCPIMKKILLILLASSATRKVLWNKMDGPRCTNLIKILSKVKDQPKQFNEDKRQILKCINDFVLGVFPALVGRAPKLEIVLHPKKGDNENSLIKLLKIKIFEQNQLKQLSARELFEQYYKPVHNILMDPKAGQNYHFMLCHMINCKFEEIAAMVTQYLVSMFKKGKEADPGSSNAMSTSLALLNSLLQPWSSIRFTTCLLKDQLFKLSLPFDLRDFMQSSQIKENGLFMLAMQQKEDKQEGDGEETKIFDLVAEMLNSAVISEEGSKISAILATITQDPEKCSYYFMLIIELNALCRQMSRISLNRSLDFEAILQMKKNNRFGMLLTIFNEIKKVVRSTLDHHLEQSFQNMLVILHLMKRVEFIMDLPEKYKNPFTEAEPLPKSGNIISQSTASIVKNLIVYYLYRFSGDPSLRILKLLNSEMREESDPNFNSPTDQINILFNETEAKLKKYIEGLQMIKFYAQNINDPDILMLLTIRSGLKIIRSMDKYVERAASEEPEEHAMLEEDPYFQSKDTYNRKYTSLLKLYDNLSSKLRAKDRKMTQIYVKIRLLTSATFEDDKTSGVNSNDLRGIVSMLENNHGELQKLLIQESTKGNEAKEGEERQQWFFDRQTGFMGFILGKLISLKEGKMCQTNKEMALKNVSVSINLLNMLKTLIDNNPNILKLTREELLKKIDGPEAICQLVEDRTKYGISLLRKSMQSLAILAEQKGQQGDQNKQKKTYIEEQKLAVREIEQFLKQSKKMYNIVSKVFSTASDDKGLIDSLKLTTFITNLDTMESLNISVYILRQIIHLSPLIYTNHKENEQVQSEIIDLIFSHLMKLRESFLAQSIVSVLGSTSESGDEEKSISVNSIIHFFLWQFFDVKHMFLLGQSQETEEHVGKVDNQEMKKKKPMCLLNRKTASLKCLSCDPNAEICLNCAVHCHLSHPLIFIPQACQILKSCQCQYNLCKISPDPKKAKAKQRCFAELGRDKNRQLDEIGRLSPEFSDPMNRQQADDQIFLKMMSNTHRVSPAELRDRFKGRPSHGIFVPPDYQEFSHLIRDQSLEQEKINSLMERKRFIAREKDRQLERKQFMRRIYNEEVIFGDNEGRDRNRIEYQLSMGKAMPPEPSPPFQDDLEDEEEIAEEFEEQDYESMILTQQNTREGQRKQQTEQTVQKYKPISRQSYLLPVFLQMVGETCEKKHSGDTSSSQDIKWNIKLQQPLKINPNLLSFTCRMCESGSFNTKMRKPDLSFHSSPCVSRASFTCNDYFIYFISGLNINLHPREKVLSFIQANKNNTVAYHHAHQHQLQYEPHSIGITPLGHLCVAGLHTISIINLHPNGTIETQGHKYSINESLNKIQVTGIGIFLGLSREIKLLSQSLKEVLTIKLQDGLIKEWCCYPSPSQEDSYTVYVIISDGYVLFTEVNSFSEGVMNFSKKVMDSRMNHPVGSFVLVKEIKGCGTLMFSSFKDKSIGHSLGRLEGSTLVSPDYIKLKGLGINPLFDTNYCMGLTDIIESNLNPDTEFYMVTIFKAELNDALAVHRGVLGVIKFKKQRNEITSYETQFVTPETKCEYFSIIKIADGSWFVLSLHEDGSLVVTAPEKIGDSILNAQIKSIADKKNPTSVTKSNPAQLPPQVQANMEAMIKLDRLSQEVKDKINLKTIKKNLQSLGLNDHYYLLENSELLKPKEDFTVSETMENKRVYEIRLNDPKKIITGIYLPFEADVILQTRKLERVFDVGLTIEESLYFYAFGVMKVQVRKIQDSLYVRESLKTQMHNMIKKKRMGESIRMGQLYEERNIFNKSAILGYPDRITDIAVYGEDLVSSFQVKAKILFPAIFEEVQKKELFSLRRPQKIEMALHVANVFVTNSLIQENYLANETQLQEFVSLLRQNLIVNRRYQEICNKNYELLKNVLIKALTIIERLSGSKMHIFNDTLHPIRYATEKKIQYLYDSLHKNEISDKDVIVLVDELHSLADDQMPHISTSMQEETVTSAGDSRNMLCYYIARYPAMMIKIHRKFKIVEKENSVQKLVPLYLVAYVVMKYLKYHISWVIPALCEAVGKDSGGSGESKPKLLSRQIFYQYLKETGSMEMEAWLKNVEAVDSNECEIEGDDNIAKEPGLLDGGVGDFMGGMDMSYLDDQEATLKKVLELSMQDAKPPEYEQPFPEEQNEMQFEQKEADKVCPLLKDITDECLKGIDFNSTDLERNIQKAVTFCVVSKIGHYNFEREPEDKTLLFIFKNIRNVIHKITENFQKTNNPNTHSILMLWMDLFGIIFKRCRPLLDRQEGEEYAVYSETKDMIMELLKNKIKVEEMKKCTILPASFMKALKGQKIQTKVPLVYGLIKILQPPCEIHYVLLALQCYWLFPENKQYYNQTKFKDTIRENAKLGNIDKVYDTAMTSVELWREVGDPEWLMDWIDNKNPEWAKALKLLSLYYDE